MAYSASPTRLQRRTSRIWLVRYKPVYSQSVKISSKMSWIRTIACVMAVTSLSVAAAQGQSSSTIRGFLRDSITGAPVMGAAVQLESGNVLATTNELGEFEVGPVPLGSHRMTIGLTGYNSRSFEFTITPEHPQDIDIGGMLLIPIVLYHIEVNGRVTNVNTGEIVEGAVVTLDGRLQTQSGQDGTFKFTTDDFEAGTSELHIRMIGYEATSYPFRVAHDSAQLNVELPLLPLPIELDEIIVEGRQVRVPSRLRGFFDRRDHSLGEFLTPWEIEATPHTRVTDLMRRMPGVAVRPTSMGGNELTLTRGCREKPRIFIDGLHVPNASIDNILQPGDVYAIELYVGSARIPPQFERANGGCGVVVFWTK